MFAAGMNYIWSVFQVPVMQYFGVSSSAASGVFYLFVTFNTIGIFTGGRLYDRIGTKIPLIIGCSFFLGGLFGCSFVPQDKFFLLYLTYSVLLSFGSGLIYVTSTSCAQKWWPEKKGFASGVVLSMLGISTLVFTPIINMLIKGDSSRVPMTFKVLGIAFSIILVAALPMIRNPESSDQNKSIVLKNGERGRESIVLFILKHKSYYLLFICTVVESIGYYTINPLAKILGAERGLSETIIVYMIMCSGIASALGRIFCGKLSDVIGSRNMFSLLFITSIISIICLAFAQNIAFFCFVTLLTFAFGGFAGISPSLGVDYFGGENVGTVISMLSIAVLTSSFLSPVITNMLASDNGSLTIYNYFGCAILLSVGFVLSRINRLPGK